MATNLFFYILVALLPCTITGYSFQATNATCEELPGDWRAIESLSECIEAYVNILGKNPAYANDNENSSDTAPCGCTYRFHELDYWGDANNGACDPAAKCTGFRDEEDMGCFCYSEDKVIVVDEDGATTDIIKFGGDILVDFEFSTMSDDEGNEIFDTNVILQRKKPWTRKARRNTRKRSGKSTRSSKSDDKPSRCDKGGYIAAEHEEELEESEEDAISGTIETNQQFYWETIFYQYTCDDVAYSYSDCEEPVFDGQLKFDVKQGYSLDKSYPKDQDYYSYFWPPADGEWRACPSIRSVGYGFEANGACADFTISPMKSKDLQKTKVNPKETEYDVNDQIKVMFEKEKKYDNAWVAVYDEAQMIMGESGENKPEHKFSYYAWAFTGCPNIGDEDNGSCSITDNKKSKKKRGKVQLPPVGSGNYYLCLSYDFDEDTRNNMKCTDEPFTVSGDNTVIMYMEKNYEFDERIDVVWENPNKPNDETNYFIHIYIAEVKSRYHEHDYRNLAFRKSACIEINPDGYTCDEPQEYGSFVFSEKTTGIVQDEFNWPPPSGEYQACLVDETEDYDVFISCERFTIKPLSQTVIEDSKVLVDKRIFQQYEDITGSYMTPKATANMWLGVYNVEDIDDLNIPLNYGKYYQGWQWAACSGGVRDSPYGKCPFREEEGEFVFHDDYNGNSALCPGEYRICLIYDDNYPHLYMKCSPKFEVIVPPTPAPTQAPTPAPTPLPTQLPTPTPTQTQAPTVTPWEQIGEDILAEESFTRLGFNLALSGSGLKLVTSGQYEARTYHYSNDNWEQLGSTLFPSLDKISAVAISSDGSRIVISENTNPCIVKVYNWIEGWDQVGSDIVGEANYDDAKSLSTSADGTIVAIGFSNYEGYDEGYDEGYVNDNKGYVKVYKEDNGAWSKFGETIDCEPYHVDVSLSASGLILAVGSINDNSKLANLSIYVSGSDQSSVWKMESIDFSTFKCRSLWVSLSADGTTVAVGGRKIWTGTVVVYNYDATLNKWSQKGLPLNGNGEDGIGSVSISGDGNRLAVGFPYLNKNKGKGSVYEYSADDGIWYNIHDENQDVIGTYEQSSFGYAVSISTDGSRVAMSGPYRNRERGFIRVLSDPISTITNNIFD